MSNTALPHHNFDISHYLNPNIISTEDDVVTFQSDTPLSGKIKSQIITRIAHFINKCIETRKSHTLSISNTNLQVQVHNTF